jgi:hypothetical protein
VKIWTADGLDAVLDEEHWKTHIVSHHPEMHDNSELVVDTLQNPRAVFRSKRDPETKIYLKEHNMVTLGDRVIPRIDLHVYVRESNGFVVTAFFAAESSRSLGEKIWPS